MSTKCETCGFEIVKDEYYPDGRCSEFCEQTSDAQKAEFKNLKPGDFGLHPCAKCGCIIDDEKPEGDSFCSSCWPLIKEQVMKVRIKDLEVALQDAITMLPSEQITRRMREAFLQIGLSTEDLYELQKSNPPVSSPSE